MRTRALGRRLARIEEALDAPGVDEATVAVRRMQLRWALLSDDRRTREAARRALNEDPEERERADMEIIRHHEIARFGRVASDFVHLFRLRERLLAQRMREQDGGEALNRWRRSMLVVCDLPTKVPLGKVLDELDPEPAYANLKGLASDVDQYDLPPVDPLTFVEAPQFLNKAGVLWEAVADALVELNSGRFVEAVLTGGIGCGKTTLALYTTAYQLYLVGLTRDPHGAHGLDPSSEILVVFQAITAHAARSVDYRRFRDMIVSSPYFAREFPFDRDLESELRFPKRVVVRPLSGASTAAIGANVIGGVIDEMNYMGVIDHSKKAVGGDGIYDQAMEAYQAVVRRRKSRFMKRGVMPGVLCLVSSRRYPGQFTDVKEQEAKTDPTIYVYDRTSWEVRPPGSFSGKTFGVFVGDGTRNPRILNNTDAAPGGAKDRVIRVPVEYRGDFEADLMAALRDYAGVSTYARHPFLMNVEAVSDCFGKVKSVLNSGSADFATAELIIYPGRIMNKDQPRFAHVDLARVSDSAGVAAGHVVKFIKIPRAEDAAYEVLPVIVLDLVLEVRPPPAGEINFGKIRALFYKLRDCGMNLKWISYDSYQSTDSLQILRQHGFTTGEQSVDRTTIPYDILKQAIYDRRLVAPEHAKAREELLRLEYDARTGKIDHPVRGSKDCADAIAGVVYGLSLRGEVWALHQVPTGFIPSSLLAAADAHET